MKPLIKKLKHLKNVSPNKDWKERNRTALLSQISNTSEAPVKETQNASAFNDILDAGLDMGKSSISFVMPRQSTLQLLKPAGALFSISLFVLSTGIFSVNASQSTIPGDTLYRLKLATERVQKALTSDEPEKAKLEIAFAGKRIEELEKIVSDIDSTEEEKDEQVAEVITKFQKNISSAQETLVGLKDSESHEETVDLAEVIDEKVNEYKETLEVVADEVSEPVKDAVENAASDAEEKGDAALSLIAEKVEQGTAPDEEVSVSEKVDKRLLEIEILLGEVTTELDFLQTNTTTDEVFSEDEEGSEENASSSTEILAAQEEIVISATEGLDGVTTLIEDEKFTEALAKIKEVRIALKAVREVLEDLQEEPEVEEPSEESTTEEPSEEPSEESTTEEPSEENENSTSTEPVIEGEHAEEVSDEGDTGETFEVSSVEVKAEEVTVTTEEDTEVTA